MMGKTFVSGGAVMTAPVKGTPLSEVAEGSIVKLNESGSPVEFYIAKHNYESDLNGAGRTLLVRKDCYDIRQWHSSNVNAYASSTIDAWLNGTYKGLLDATIQDAIATTKFYYTPGKGNTTLTTLARSIFLLSINELGCWVREGMSGETPNKEGSELPIASTLQVAYRNGSAVEQWTRSACPAGSNRAYRIDSGGYLNYYGYCANATAGSRPCFTLPATALVQTDGAIKI